MDCQCTQCTTSSTVIGEVVLKHGKLACLLTAALMQAAAASFFVGSSLSMSAALKFVAVFVASVVFTDAHTVMEVSCD